MRTKARRDKNEHEIIAALKLAGASVQQISAPGVPDLLVSYYDPQDSRSRTILIEVKEGYGKLTPAEKSFIEEWQGEIHVVYSVDEALEAIGRL